MKRYQEDPETPTHLRKLLESARGDDLDAKRTQRVAKRMGIAAALAKAPESAVFPTAARSPAPLAKATLRTLVVVGAGLCLVGGVVGTSSWRSASDTAPPASTTSRVAVVSAVPAPPVVAAVTPVTPVAPITTANTEPPPVEGRAEPVPAMSVAALPNAKLAAPAARPVPDKDPAAASPSEGDQEDLRAELLALDAVRTATSEGRPRTALSLLDTYASKHRAGKLREEASVLRIEALAASGDRAGASSLADRLLRESPNTVYAARVRAAVSRASSPEQQ